MEPDGLRGLGQRDDSVETDYHNENGKLVFDVGRFGFFGENGDFVERPKLDPIPRFTSNIEDSFAFKREVFGSYLVSRTAEVDGEWGTDFDVKLFDRSGSLVHGCIKDELPVAMISAVPGALMCGWSHDRARFELIER